jgi:NAD(P) transhydrogenase subunit beta
MEMISPFILELTVFILAVFVGYYVVWKVTPALHSPLMSVTNAISSVIVVGAVLAAGSAQDITTQLFGLGAVVMASVNIFGGFVVTRRMLEMFNQKKEGLVEKKTYSFWGWIAVFICIGLVARFVGSTNISALAYLASSVCFILALQGLSSAKTSQRGLALGELGMGLAVIITLGSPVVTKYGGMWIILGIIAGTIIGTTIAKKIQMTALPQLVAAFHSLVGLAAVCVAAAALLEPQAFDIGAVGSIAAGSLIEMGLGVGIGAITFTGSLVAFAKLQGLVSGNPLIFKGQHTINALLGIGLFVMLILFAVSESHQLFWALTFVAFLLGFLLILPIGGADMPVVISMLNSYSGWAAAGIGFTLGNSLLIITGALVGSSGAILSYIMCKGMNRSILNIILGGFGGEAAAASQTSGEQRPFKAGSAEDAGFIMKNAKSVIIVPGYGMAVAQAQHALREMADILQQEGVEVRYAIHPVAGRMPGNMNVLLAEANVPYENVLELDEINRDFAQTDVAFVIGANDVTNPSAKTDPKSPIYGMPILDVEKAKTVLFVKRSMSPGYAGVDNELFYRDNTLMLFGDAKKMCEEIIKTLEE